MEPSGDKFKGSIREIELLELKKSAKQSMQKQTFLKVELSSRKRRKKWLISNLAFKKHTELNLKNVMPGLPDHQTLRDVGMFIFKFISKYVQHDASDFIIKIINIDDSRDFNSPGNRELNLANSREFPRPGNFSQ